MSDRSPESWFDAQLRQTPLPKAFFENLRAIAREEAETSTASDEALDRRLADVPLPEGLVPRLLASLQRRRLRRRQRDEALDRVLNQVPVPAHLLADVRAAVDDEALDELLRAVPVPDAALARARIIPHLERRLSPVIRGMAAAILFFVVGASYFAAVTTLTRFGSPLDRPQLSPLAVDWGPLELEASPTEAEALVDLASDVIALPAVAAANEEPAWEVFEAAPSQGPASEIARVLGPRGQGLTNVVLARWQPLAAQPMDDRLPDLEWAPKTAARGGEPPPVRGFDRVFLFKSGVFPLVDPSVHASLERSTTALSTSTASFDWAERLVAGGRAPRPRDIRLEDFLAALDYGFLPPQRPDSVELRTAAGPSVFGNVDADRGLYPQLLQVAAIAGSSHAPATSGTHLTVAVDVSAGMEWNDGLERAQRGLVRLLDHLAPADRISLVAFNEEVVWLVEDASSADRQKLLETIHRLQSHGARNIPVGLRAAVSAALDADLDEGVARRVVLLTEGRLGLSEEDNQAIENFVRAAAEQGLRLDVIDTAHREAFPADLEQIAAAGEGQVRRGDTADEIRWALVESLAGRSPVVASQASISIRFNPEAVARYRLLGHEPPAAGMAFAGAEAGELRNLQAATVLYEVWLYPNEKNDVATAELTWIDARTGAAQRQEQPISRIQFASSFAESAAPLQAAALAAQTAELLRQSPFVPPGPRDYGKILELASAANPRLAGQEGFLRLLAFVRQLHERQNRTGF
jgi:Ca-activated chloride channel family protein